MTTLQEKAEEYAKRECGYNIDCDTAVSCTGCQWLDNSITENQMRNSSKGFIAGYQAAKHEDRWRSVDEELPEPGAMVLIRGRDCDEQKEDDIQFEWYTPLLGRTNDLMSCWTTESFEYLTHWKPIEL